MQIRPQYSIGISRRLYAFSGQSSKYYRRGKNRHEIMADRSPQTQTATARHRYVRTPIRQMDIECIGCTLNRIYNSQDSHNGSRRRHEDGPETQHR